MNLKRLLEPTWAPQGTLCDLPLEVFSDRGIESLVLDVDCTLLPRHSQVLPERVVRWVHDARQQFRLHLFSNNPSRRRIEAVANSFELPYAAGAGKPRRGPLRQVLEQLQLPAQQVALIGDRVFTDVLAGNRLGLFTVLVHPIGASGQASPRPAAARRTHPGALVRCTRGQRSAPVTQRTLVVKVGTSLLRAGDEFSASAAANLSAERQRGTRLVLVTSGAVGLGCNELGLAQRPQLVEELQAAAAIGQGQLMARYDAVFRPHGQTVAQVLLTRGDLASRRRFIKASRTLLQLLSWDVLPIINENDTLATEELRFGDNDTLSALVAVAIGADELLLLTDVDRLYSADPKENADARPIREVRDLDELNALDSAAGDGGRWGTGGMTTKLAAARIATASGIQVRLGNGRNPAVVRELLGGGDHGTRFLPSSEPIPDRKGWLAHALVPEADVLIDAGAEKALIEQGGSLLAVGVSGIEGSFEAQQPVRIRSSSGQELARGLSRCSSDRLQGVVVHRDQLVITAHLNRPTIPPRP